MRVLMLLFIALFSFSTLTFAATVSVVEVKPGTNTNGDFVTLTVESKFDGVNESEIWAKGTFLDSSTSKYPLYSFTDAMYKKINSKSKSESTTEPRTSYVTVYKTGKYAVDRVDFNVKMFDKRNVKVAEYQVGASSLPTNTVIPPSLQVDNRSSGMTIIPPSGYDMEVFDRTGKQYSGDSEVRIPYSNSTGGNYDFSWEHCGDGSICYSYDNMNTFSRWTFPYSGYKENCLSDTCETAPTGGEVVVQILDEETEEVLEEYTFREGELISGGGSGDDPQFPINVILTDKVTGKEYEYEIDENGDVVTTGGVGENMPDNPPEDDHDPNPDGTDPGTDPGSGGGSCVCCERLVELTNQLLTAAEQQGYKLDGMKGVLDAMKQAIDEQGLDLKDVKSLLGTNNALVQGTNQRLDTANSHLQGIKDQVTPKGNYSIPQPNFQQELDKVSVPYVDGLKKVEDKNVYFSDPGQDTPVPIMPAQPQENYPVPIGESLMPEATLTAEPSLNKAPEMTKDAPKQIDPIRSIQQMERDPVRDRTFVNADPVRQRTHIYERQEPPK